MRIITGKAKGMTLYTLEGTVTRPTAERTKEAVFSAIQFSLEGASVLDLFAGSGQLGLEALSRGAKKAVFVDKDKNAIEIIKKNIEKTKAKEYATVVNSDFETYLCTCKGKEKFDIVFLDPPYASDYTDRAVSLLFDFGYVKPDTYFILESDRDGILSEENEKRFETVKSSKYGIAYVCILKPKECKDG